MTIQDEALKLKYINRTHSFGIIFVIINFMELKNLLIRMKSIKKLISLSILFLLLTACEKSSYEENSYLIAMITGFDWNCSTCILEFPEDSLKVKIEIGQSPDNKYQSVNLNKGNYQIGQLLKVKIRTPDANELAPCIDLYPSFNYKSIYITDYRGFDDLKLNDTLSLACHDCLNDIENQMYICLDSVLNDSRCPSGVYCFWEGNATVRFKFQKYNSEPVIFDLNTHKGFTSSTIIDSYKFTLLGLTPYPVANQIIEQKKYIAKILIEKP
jgi:hypothetical protein